MNDPFRVYKSFGCKSFGLVGTTFPKAFVKCIPTSTIYLIKKNSITIKQCLTNNLIFPPTCCNTLQISKKHVILLPYFKVRPKKFGAMELITF